MTQRDQIKYAIALLVMEEREIPKYHARFSTGYGSYHWTMERDKVLMLGEPERTKWAQRFISLRGTVELPQNIKKRFMPRSKPINQINATFYRKMWDAHATEQGWCRCEECHKILLGYSAHFISHNLSRGAYPQLRDEPENITILCREHHDQWETGNRKAMRIYPEKANIMHKLKLRVANELNSKLTT